jgi:hypothetical protein
MRLPPAVLDADASGQLQRAGRFLITVPAYDCGHGPPALARTLRKSDVISMKKRAMAGGVKFGRKRKLKRLSAR